MHRSRNAALVLLVVAIGATAGCTPSLPSRDAAGTTIGGGDGPTPHSHDAKDVVRSCEPDAAADPSSAREVRDCYTRRLSEVLHSKGPAEGMRTLYQLAEASPRFANLCHETAHRVSELMYESLGNIHDAMALCRTDCAYACQHAVIRSYLRGLPQGTLPELGRLCPRHHPDEHSMDLWQCTHGVGHGLAHYFPDVHHALATCRQFSAYWDHRRCVQGVFMESVVITSRAHESSPPVQDPLQVCRTLEPDEQFDCYNLLIKLVGLEAGDPVPSRFAACDAIPPEHRAGCYFGIGRLLTGTYLEREEELIRVCHTGDPTFSTECLLGFSAALVNSTNLDRGFEFCRKLDHGAQIRCAESMGRAVRIRWSERDRVAIECTKAGAPAYVRACREVDMTPDTRRPGNP